MKSNKQLWKICVGIYREQYKKAWPSTDFDTLVESGEVKKNNFFMEYYLPKDMHDEIIERHMKKHKLTAIERNKISWTVNLGCSPSSVYNNRFKGRTE